MRKQSILNEFQQKLKTSTFFQKILYSFLLIASICLTVFCLCIVSFINKNQQSFLRDLQDNTISRAYNVNQTALKDIIRYCDTMMGDYTVKSLLYSEEHDVPMMLKCNDICDSICKISSMIDSVYFVNYNSGTVLSSAGSSAIDRFRDQEVLTLLEDIVPSQSPQVCCPRMVAPGQPGSESIPMLTLIYRYSKQGAMVLNLNYQTYSEMLYPDSSEYLSLIMVNQDDVVFFSSDPVLWGCNYREDETYRTIGSFMNNRGTYTHTVDGTEYTVKYIKNSGFGITYLCLLQNTSLYLDMSLISAIQIYVTVSLLLAIVLSIIMSFINYRPIKHLKSYVDSQLPDSSAAISGRYNEFRYFFDRYQKLLNVNKQYENRLNEEKVQKIYLDLLIDAPDTYIKYTDELKNLQTTIDQSSSFILQMTIDPEFQKSTSRSDLDLMTFAIYNMTEEKLSEIVQLQLLQFASPSITFLAHAKDLSAKQLEETLQYIQSVMLYHFTVTFSAGIGKMIDDITEVSLSYESACQALSMRFLYGGNAVYFAGSIPTVSITEEVYPYETEDGLINGIKAMSVRKVSDSLDAFFSTVGAYSIDRILMYVLWLSASIQRLEYEYSVDIDTFWNYGDLEKSTIDVIRERLNERCLNVIEQIRNQKETSSIQQEIVDTVIKMISNNIDNPNLSVIYLANHVHLSVNYLRSIFKNSVGESLSSYITRKKVDMICHLLVDSELSLGEIGEKLGYSTQNYFFTFFKKHMGMTPKEYQRKMKHAQHDDHTDSD